TPDGPRQTAMLADRLDETAPYGWTRGSPTVGAYVSGTIHRLGGTGLPPRELDALVAYVTSLHVPAAPAAGSRAEGARGKAILESKPAGCWGCHAGARLTDRRAHAIASTRSGDSYAAFDTPSLRYVGHTAPYFHDGRYPTLRALIDDVDGSMGHTAHL